MKQRLVEIARNDRALRTRHHEFQLGFLMVSRMLVPNSNTGNFCDIRLKVCVEQIKPHAILPAFQSKHAFQDESLESTCAGKGSECPIGYRDGGSNERAQPAGICKAGRRHLLGRKQNTISIQRRIFEKVIHCLALKHFLQTNHICMRLARNPREHRKNRNSTPRQSVDIVGQDTQVHRLSYPPPKTSLPRTQPSRGTDRKSAPIRASPPS